MTENGTPKQVPGPHGRQMIHELTEFLSKEPFDVLMECHKEYGDLFQLNIAGSTVYVTRDPDMAQHVLQLNNHNYVKWDPRAEHVLKSLIGDSIFMTEGDVWRKERRIMQPAFHRRRIATLADTMILTIQEMLDSWEPIVDSGETINVVQEMRALTMEIITRTMFSDDLGPDDIKELSEFMHDMIGIVAGRLKRPFAFMDRFHPRENRRVKQHLEDINKFLYRMIEKRRASGESKDDLLSLLMDAVDEETGDRLDDKQIRDELLIIFVAGHETTMLTLSWAHWLLSLHPTVRHRLEEEADAVFGDDTPRVEHFSQLTYAQQVLNETLRLYTPPFALSRVAVGDDQIDDYELKAPYAFLVHVYGLHRNTEYWENPEGFDPDRFTPENSKGRHRYAFLPFGGGPRLCIGNNFAIMESTFTLAMIARKYRLNVVPGEHVTPHLIFTLHPVDDRIPVTVHKRT